MIDVYYGKNEYKTEGLKPSVFPLLRQIAALLFYTSGSLRVISALLQYLPYEGQHRQLVCLI